MSFFDFVKGKVQQETPRLLCVSIPPERVDAHFDASPLAANQRYVRLWLAEMFLKHDKKWFTDLYPVVHSVVTLTAGTQKEVELVNVAGPLKLPQVESASLGKVVPLNFPLTGLLPFVGGVIQLGAGLVALEASNQLKPFLETMERFSALLCCSPLSTALGIASPVAQGVQSLLVAGDRGLQLGLHQAFTSEGGCTGNELRAGYTAVVLATANDLDPKRLFVKEGRLCEGTSLVKSAPLAGFTYMLFRIESRTERDDWESLVAIAEPFQRAVQAASLGNAKEADALVNAAMLATWQSPDLTRTDRVRVTKLIREEYDTFRGSMGLGAVPEILPTLEAVMAKAPTAPMVGETLAGLLV